MSDSHILQASGVRFSYPGGKSVLSGVDLTVRPGRVLSILGPNGSGKTTLLKCLLGQLRCQGGIITLDGRELRRRSARSVARLMAYVPQMPQSAFAFSVREIILMGRYAHAGMMGLTGRGDLAVASQAMLMTGTLDLGGRTLDELSGGEAQRVMIARALAQQPSVMLLDEPTSHLDIRNQLNIHEMLRRVAHDWPMAVICVSHDINLAARFSDELVLMRDGVVAAAGRPADVVQPEILSKVYDVRVSLLRAEGGVPVVWAQ